MNRNIFSLVLSNALNMLVFALEIAKGVRKSSGCKSSRTPSAQATTPRLMFALAPRALTATLVPGGISVVHAQTAIITNGGFETGDLTGWTAGGGTGTQSSSQYNANGGVDVSVVTGMTSFDSQWNMPTGAGAMLTREPLILGCF
ncbi:ESPR-type extended signal peptide-containing protein [Rhodanobacter sp. Si-c]|uniref:ESPR-type extended signal peptide-containing protein n=1 Tax=Rhodanobacter lycopersici TaxID=3162487 RepID=A0ABV3QJ00_9GAMM